MKISKHDIITLIPFLMVINTGLSALFYTQGWYEEIFKYLPDSTGYSILTNVVFIFLYFRRKFCTATKVCVVGLLIMNIISLVFVTGGMMYNYIYDVWICLIILVVSIFTLVRWR